MATTADFKNGLVIEFNSDLYMIVEFQHVKPGKGGAFVRTKLKSLTNGRVLENTFNAGAKVTTARVERHKCQYMYNDGETYTFMDVDSYEQIPVDKNLISEPRLLTDNQEVNILQHQETSKIIGVEFPAAVTMKVEHSDPGVKGNTATRAMKPATTESGLELLVPLFVEEGDMIKIDTKTLSYIERVK